MYAATTLLSILHTNYMSQVATFVGADASVHMAEEVDNAALNIPRASKHNRGPLLE
jgi:hypothetical protein